MVLISVAQHKALGSQSDLPDVGVIMPQSIKVVSFAVIGFLLVSTMVVAQEKPRLAVLNFATRGQLEEADAVAEELRGAFVKSGKYTVVDRTQTDQIMKEWETQQSGLTDDKKAIKIGKLLNVKLIVTGKLNKFSSGGWQVSAVMLNAQTGVTLKSERVRHRGDFFGLLDSKIPEMATKLASSQESSQPQNPKKEKIDYTVKAKEDRRKTFGAITVASRGIDGDKHITIFLDSRKVFGGSPPWKSEVRKFHTPYKITKVTPGTHYLRVFFKHMPIYENNIEVKKGSSIIIKISNESIVTAKECYRFFQSLFCKLKPNYDLINRRH